MTVYDRIRVLREKTGMSQQELANRVGFKTASAVNKIELGLRDISQTKLNEFAKALNTTPGYLLGWEDNEHASNSFALPSNILPLPKTYKVPLLGSIACGTPILAAENIETYINVPDDIRCNFTLRCKGDSMIGARINDGDIVFIRQQPDVENGEIAAVLIDGMETEATLKRVYKGDGQITLMPANEKYPPFVYVGEDMNRVRIIGKAVAFVSAVR